MALWDGLIQRKIEGFLMTDMSVTREKAFAALWESIKVGKDQKES
jgi:hypothetical protein